MGVAKGVANMGLRAGVDGVILVAGEVGLETSTGPVMSCDYEDAWNTYVLTNCFQEPYKIFTKL